MKKVYFIHSSTENRKLIKIREGKSLANFSKKGASDFFLNTLFHQIKE